MAYILGTAGHVDHGKTALVKKLTGVETSHLPEEKRRGMTIELGFASLDDPTHGKIGIVDVPGHERFIRNMVAGTWGLDAALLVIAADDGWMQMSADHLRVLKAMQINSVLLVITKADLVEPDMINLIIEDANENAEKIIGKKLPSVAVSAMTGFGIEDLKKEITKLLSSSKKQNPDTSFLYIDRAFNLKGIGTTITGTLRGKKLHIGNSLFIYPVCEECRIKSIQNHHQAVEEIEPGARTALNLKTEDKTKIERGMLLAEKDHPFILHGRELLIRVDEVFSAEGKLKNHLQVELALGSAHEIGIIHFNKLDKSLARLSLEKSIACGWNQRAVIIRHGGSEILASCRILSAFQNYRRVQFKEGFEIYRDKELPSVYAYQFRRKGFIENANFKIQELSNDIEETLEYEKIRFLKTRLAEWEDKILKTAKNSQAGFTLEETYIPVPTNIKQIIFKKLCTEKKLENNGHIYNEKGRTVDDISKNAKDILTLALKSGLAGIAVDKLSIPQSKKEVRDLVKLGKLICLEDFLHYHKDIYDNITKKILQKFKRGDIITISEARDITGLSRKYVLPILNLLEKEKKLRRNGNDRIVL